MLSLNLLKTRHRRGGNFISVKGLQFGRWRPQNRLRREDYCSLDKVLQFANIPRPTVSNKHIHGLGRDFVDSFVHSSGVEGGEVPDQFRNVFSALPQSWNVDRKYFQP